MPDGIWQDLRYGVRSLAKTPAFTAVAVVSLALGIGVNLAIFGFVNSALFKPLAVERPGGLVSLYHRAQTGGEEFYSTSYPEYEFYRDHNTAFTGMLAYLRAPMIVGAGADARRFTGELVSPEYFGVLGLRPAAGRFFADGETGPVAVISEALWRERFAREPAALGASIRIGSGMFTIIGVAPGEFRGIVLDWVEPPAVWVPVKRYAEAVPAFPFDVTHAWGMESYLITARLRPGVSAEQAGAQMAALTVRLREERRRRERQTAVVIPVQQARFWPSYRGGILTFLGALTALVGAILLIACCNIANLLLARADGRRREVAMRLALGAGHWRIARQLLMESLLLAAAGGTAAAAVGAWASRFLAGFHRAFRIPLAIDAAWDWRVLAFAVAVSALAGILFGAAPVVATWRADLVGAMKAGSAAAGNPRSRLRGLLLAAQVALCTTLLAGAGLFVLTLRNARAEGPSDAPAHLLLARLEPSTNGYTAERGGRLYADVLARVRALPGVRSAGLVFVVPFSGMRGGHDVIAADGSRQPVDFNVVSPGYFMTAGLPLVRGRDFAEGDGGGVPGVAIVNERFAARFWPGEDPIGRQFRMTDPVEGTRAGTVVGVVRDGKVRSHRDALRSGFYVPLAQQYRGEMTLEMRTASAAALMVGAVRRAVRGLDAGMPLPELETMETHLDDALSQERLIAAFASGLGLLALALAATGIYGVLSFMVSRRTREIGIRMALGARPGEVSLLFLLEPALPAGAGLAVGAVAAALLARLAKSMLYGVAPLDLLSFGAAFGILVLAGAAAAVIPASRAARLDPAEVLRNE